MIKEQYWNHPKFSNSILAESLDDILSNNKLLSLATVKKEGKNSIPLNATCGFAFDDKGAIYVLTPPTSNHGLALHTNPHVAITIFDSRQDLQAPKQGLQISGTSVPGHQADFEKGIKTYKERFRYMEDFVRWHPEWRRDSVKSWIYKISPVTVKIFDEEKFGEEKFVTIIFPEPHMKI